MRDHGRTLSVCLVVLLCASPQLLLGCRVGGARDDARTKETSRYLRKVQPLFRETVTVERKAYGLFLDGAYELDGKKVARAKKEFEKAERVCKSNREEFGKLETPAEAAELERLCEEYFRAAGTFMKHVEQDMQYWDSILGADDKLRSVSDEYVKSINESKTFAQDNKSSHEFERRLQEIMVEMRSIDPPSAYEDQHENEIRQLESLSETNRKMIDACGKRNQDAHNEAIDGLNGQFDLLQKQVVKRIELLESGANRTVKSSGEYEGIRRRVINEYRALKKGPKGSSEEAADEGGQRI